MIAKEDTTMGTPPESLFMTLRVMVKVTLNHDHFTSIIRESNGDLSHGDIVRAEIESQIEDLPFVTLVHVTSAKHYTRQDD